MTTATSLRNELRDLYIKESTAIEQEFLLLGDGRIALARRTALVDSIVQRLWNEIFVAADPSAAHSTLNSNSSGQDGPINFTLVATGGFGRGWLFPHSDIDLLFLHANADSENPGGVAELRRGDEHAAPDFSRQQRFRAREDRWQDGRIFS